MQDGNLLADGSRRVISKHIHFVEINEDGTALNAGFAPYLDYRAATSDELSEIQVWKKSQKWLSQNIEGVAKEYAIKELIPAHFQQVKAQKEHLINKTAKAVKDRLTAEIQYWDYRAGELQQKENAGKNNSKLNSKLAARRAEDLENRMRHRLDELVKEKHISPLPPVVTGGALVIPKGLLHSIMAAPCSGIFSLGDKREIEYAAMSAVIEIEKKFGYLPIDVSASKCGYDVESRVPNSLRINDTHSLRFIEVKGRKKGADTITVSKNEILTALNKPDNFILAIVEVDDDKNHVVYLKKPFKSSPDFTATSVNYNIKDLVKEAEILYET